MLLTKIISGVLVGAAIILSVILLKPVWLLMVAFISVVGTWELAQMLGNKGHRVSFRWPAALNLTLLVGVYLLVESDISPLVQDWNIAHAQVLAWINTFMVFASLALIVRSLFRKPRANVVELFAPLFQIAYLGWFPSFFILLRAIPGGEFFLVWALTSVAFSDIGAYFAGKYLGKHPYFQHLSPNKTIEGALGGIAASVAMAALLAFAFGRWLPIPWYHLLILATGMACLGQMGDLVESLIKRDMDVKDSGNLIPGHGGMLDRVDSYILLAPFLYYYLTNFVLFQPTAAGM
ncbi:MAG: phosphatidate cytidylyltransferase [Candidatus Sericytochromatia bacterium]